MEAYSSTIKRRADPGRDSLLKIQELPEGTKIRTGIGLTEMEHYTDIHSHILPGVDDGAADMEMTMEMIGMAYSQGVRSMIATPHYYPGHVKHPKEHVDDVFRETLSEVKKRYEDFTILLGNEIYYREGALQKLRENRVHTMADTPYVLIEFSPGAPYQVLCGAVRKCVEGGYYPVLAHIERYQSLWKDEKNVRELVRMGAYMQVNAENFSGGLFSAQRRWCLRLAKEGLLHFIGSDAHNTGDRCPNIKQAADCLREKLDEGTFRRIMYDNPERLLKGEYLK